MTHPLVGTLFPAVDLWRLTSEGPGTVATHEYFADKKIIVIGLPGAYTPLCTSRHVPEFAKMSSQLKAEHIDEIVCISVNDPFVMDAWGRSMGAHESITFLADAEAALTKALKLELDAYAHGLGVRSQRYALLVDNNTIRSAFVEPSAGTCGISSAQNMIDTLKSTQL